ncbi:MAG TPA: hypothetical protein VJA27_01515, partial [Patescibacteria group bacterium]|nr:hypothetical protein [Patescibacteria group bacterium]
QHLANFFAATRTDFRTIDAEVRAVASNQGGHYYWENRLAGSFYRRWSEMGSPHDGDALISRLRFWMVKAAFALNHPAARAWAREVQVEITATSNPALKKDFYLAELRKLVDG